VLSPEAATNLYRIAQECLNNIIKHSEAKRVSITLERDVRHVRFVVEDDGKSFNVEQVLSGAAPGGLGLRNIVERVHIMNGTVRLDSLPGKGTRIEVEVPVAEGTAG
jgi:signal transduction histidine kinase